MNRSYWIDSTDDPDYPVLAEDVSTSVAVVGAGIAGLTAAVLLKQAGFRVVVLEAREVGAGVTGHTTGKLTAGQRLAYSRLEHLYGSDMARAYAESQTAGLDLVFRLAADLEIDCDLERVPNLVFAEDEDEVGVLEQELTASASAGLPVELVEQPDAPFPARAALRLAGQGQFHARKYLIGLAREVHGDGSAVYRHTRVVGMEPGPTTELQTEQGPTVRATSVVLATNAPITSRSTLYARALPWRSYAVAGAVSGRAVEGMWINVATPTRSVRTHPLPDGRRLVIVVGEGHRVGQEDGSLRYQALEAYLREHFAPATPEYRWSTQDLYSVDELPYVGRVTRDGAVYVATGFGGWGLTNGSLAGLLLRDAIAGRENAWLELLDPGRSTLAGVPGALVRENVNVARHLVGGKLRRRPTSAEDVVPGQGEVVELDGEKAAVYRDGSGVLHAVSAVCTHMGCIVEWNQVEGSWDCPCHGSRFTVDGEILDGPATRPLAPVAAEAPSRR